MRGPAADHNLDILRDGAVFQDFTCYRDAYFFDDPQDIALCGIGIRTQHKVRRCEGIEVRDMAVNESSRIVQFPEFFCCGRRIDLIHCICGLTRGQVVYAWSNTADPRNHTRNLLYRHSFDEFLKSAQFRNLEIAVGYASILCEKDVNFSVSLKPGYGINRNAFHSTFLVMSDAGIPKRLKLRRESGIWSMIRCTSASSLASMTEAIADIALAP